MPVILTKEITLLLVELTISLANVLKLNMSLNRLEGLPKLLPCSLLDDGLLKSKYGSNVDSIHHYEITEESGHAKFKIDVGTVNTDYPSSTPITNREFEEEEQDIKRRIKLLDPQYVTDFVEEFKRLTRENVI